MNDKKPLVAHRQYGKDEDSTQALIKKQEAIELEIDGYSVKVAELETESQRMLRKEHFDSDTIRERQVTQHMQHHLIDWITVDREIFTWKILVVLNFTVSFNLWIFFNSGWLQ